MSKILDLQSMPYAPSAAAGNSNKSNTCQGNSCISIFCGGGGHQDDSPVEIGEA